MEVTFHQYKLEHIPLQYFFHQLVMPDMHTKSIRKLVLNTEQYSIHINTFLYIKTHHTLRYQYLDLVLWYVQY